MLPRLVSNLKRHRALSFGKQIVQNFSGGVFSNFNEIISTKGCQGAAELTDPNFWDTQYKLNKDSEWYIHHKHAANFVHNILRARNLIKHDKLNILLEIGCGSSPVVVPLIPLFNKSRFLAIGIATDVSRTCISNLKKDYSNIPVSVKTRLPRLRSGNDPDSLSFLAPGVLSSNLDITNIRDFVNQLECFPVRFPDAYSEDYYCKDKSKFKTNVIIIDKGCLDAFIWDEKVGCIESVLNASNGIVSLSGEDPDSRLDYFQEQFSKRFSVHFLNDESKTFGYSFANK